MQFFRNGSSLYVACFYKGMQCSLCPLFLFYPLSHECSLDNKMNFSSHIMYERSFWWFHMILAIFHLIISSTVISFSFIAV